MKRITFLSFALLAGFMSMSATDAYNCDFETEATSPVKITSGGWISDGSLQIVENPLKQGINESNSVLTFEAQEGIEWWGGPNVEFKSTTTTESMRYVYIKVLAEDSFTANLRIRLFTGTNGDYTDLNTDYTPTRVATLSTEWKEFCFVLDPGITFSMIRITPNYFGSFYIDDIILTDKAPEVPLLKPFKIDFENENEVGNWDKNSDEGAVYRCELTEDPFNSDGNSSSFTMKAWITNGTEPNFGGARYNDIYGMTNDRARYLHVKCFFQSNEDAWNAEPKPLRIFTGITNEPIESSSVVASKWHDVTIDLGEETLVKYLAFNFNGWWMNVGIDDIQLDWDPYERAELEGYVSQNDIVSHNVYAMTNGIYVDGINHKTQIEIYTITGTNVKNISLSAPGLISLNSGIYMVKVIDSASNEVKKIIVR